MNRGLSNSSLSELSEFIENKFALHFPMEKWNNLERSIKSAAKEFGYLDAETFINHIMSSPLTREYSELLASHLTINETYFWREPQAFETLEKKILPELIRLRENGNKSIRIWSAGCSGGEEPYSIAIALTRFIPNIKDWNISILATDINPHILQKAAKGEYSEWSFRNVPVWLKEKYFIKKDKGKYQIIPEIKNMVTFNYLNLAEDTYPSQLTNTNAMDIIFCRNVLMYFKQERFRRVVKGLHNSLVEGAYLIVSASELSIQNFQDFLPVNIPGFVLYQKVSEKKLKQCKGKLTEFYQKPEIIHVFSKPESVPEIFKTTIKEQEPFVFKEKEIPQKTVQIPKEILDSFSKGDYTEVIHKLEKTEQTAVQQLLIIRAFANAGQLTEAFEACQEALALDKLDAKMHYLCATILQELNQPENAIAALKRAIYIDPDFVLPYYSLGNLYRIRGNLPGAKKCYKNCLSIMDKCGQDDILPESEGLTVGRFKKIIKASM